VNEAVEHFKWWLQMQATGCVFAAALAKAGRVAYEPHVDIPQVDDLNTNFDVYGQRGLCAILLLPFVMSERELVNVLSGLQAGSSRWRIRDLGLSAAGNTLVGLEWTTAHGDVSDAMGFAPLPAMPVPRRSPYFAIALWPGGQRNTERGIRPTPRARPGEVSFLDAEHAFRHDVYEKMWTETERAVADLMSAPPDDARRYRKVAFVLSSSAAAALTFDA
jgi:hypothetical protein